MAHAPSPPGATQRAGAPWRIAAAVLGIAVLGPGAWALHLRYVRSNFHEIIAGKAYRSAQPGVAELRKWKEACGLRTVINLRGDQNDRLVLAEQPLVRGLGLRLVPIYMSSRRLPGLQELSELVRQLEDPGIQPCLIHCRNGVDRTGLVSVMAAMAVGGQDFATARRQCSWRYLKPPTLGANVSDLLTEYEDFRPYYSLLQIDLPPALKARPGEIVAVPARITNRSYCVLPFSDPDKQFTFVGTTSLGFLDDPVHLGKVRPPARDLPPGGSIDLAIDLLAPAKPGIVRLPFDVFEEGQRWFCKFGSPVGVSVLTVE